MSFHDVHKAHRVGWLRFGRLQLALRLRKMTGGRGTDETMPDAAA